MRIISTSDRVRSRIVRWVARKLGVPIAIHQTFFMKGTSVKMS